MKKITIMFMMISMFFISCSTNDEDYDEVSQLPKNEVVENPKEPSDTNKDDSETNPSDDENIDESDTPSENTDALENKNWCEVDENITITELDYIVCWENTETKLNLQGTHEDKVREYGTYVSGVINMGEFFRKALFRMKYKDGKLMFSDDNIPTINKVYVIENVENINNSTIRIHIQWKN